MKLQRTIPATFITASVFLTLAGCTGVHDVNRGDSFQSQLSFDLVLVSKTKPGVYVQCPKEMLDKIITNAVIELDNPNAAAVKVSDLKIAEKKIGWSSSGKNYTADGIKLSVQYEGQIADSAEDGEVYVHLRLPELKNLASELDVRPAFISVMDEKAGLGEQRNLHLTKRDTDGSLAIGKLNIHESRSGKFFAIAWKTVLGLVIAVIIGAILFRRRT